MSIFDEYRRNYPSEDEPLSQENLAAIVDELQTTASRVSRVAGAVSTLLRTLQRHRENAQLPMEQKRRMPRVVKSDPFGGSNFLAEARAALALGSYAEWSAQCRHKLAEAAAVA